MTLLINVCSTSVSQRCLPSNIEKGVREAMHTEAWVGHLSQRAGLMNANEAAKFLGIGKSTLLRKAYANEVPSITIGSRRLFPIREIQNWIAANVRMRLLKSGEVEEYDIPDLMGTMGFDEGDSDKWEEINRSRGYET